MKASASQQLHFLWRDTLPLVTAIKDGFAYDPGHSDLDDEQPIHVSITLGDYRRAVRLYYELRKE